MHKFKQTLFAALFLSLAGVITAGAQSTAEVNNTLDDLFGEHAPYHEFFEKLKKAVAEHDKQTVASMVDYPFKARINGKAVTIRDAAHFAADYDEVFTNKVRDAVAKQTYENLSANWQGVMIGDGEVWFSGICNNDACEKQTVRIIAVND
ncbi:hypothetical protein L598_006000000090 [Mesorhizobium sp. J18]|uniref:hypothetical protein n=1 Tax=Mesorhizobium sp. J18 TaxID=935263 RepID=UPI00119BDE95|nr:hypothetical protein [Mesorhizobium sp. J18]TWG91113.1 hypothetical protein L598_006000000090 [Mesorhizobium sp. J18]